MATSRKIDMRDTADLTPFKKRVFLNKLAREVRSEWRRMAAALPSRYRSAYLQSMAVRVTGDDTITLELDSDDSVGSLAVLARSVEYGYGPGGVGTTGPYDMRKTLLKSPSVKFGKRGRYLNVPMRTTRRGMEKLGGKGAYAAAKALTPTVHGRWGGRLSDPSGYADKIHPVSRMVPGIGFVPPHTTDPLASMYKFASAGQGGATYGTFRTISEGGKPWVHPGVPAHRLIRKVAGRLPIIIASMRR